MTTLLHRMRGAARRFGLDVRRYSAPPLVPLLAHHECDLVLDVGARTGEFAAELRLAGYTGRIVSFEPLALPRAALHRRAAGDPAWTVLPYALGDRDGSDRESTNRASSNRESDGEVEVRRLEGLWESVVAPGERPFLKLDVRGHETRVLDGLGAHHDDVVGLQIETSLVPLHAGGPLLDETLDRVRDGLGFSLMSVVPGCTEPRSGRMLQCDLVLFREAEPQPAA